MLQSVAFEVNHKIHSNLIKLWFLSLLSHYFNLMIFLVRQLKIFQHVTRVFQCCTIIILFVINSIKLLKWYQAILPIFLLSKRHLSFYQKRHSSYHLFVGPSDPSKRFPIRKSFRL